MGKKKGKQRRPADRFWHPATGKALAASAIYHSARCALAGCRKLFSRQPDAVVFLFSSVQ
jgi:hypothetical protein